MPKAQRNISPFTVKQCENDSEKESLKKVIFNNLLMNTIVDGRKYIRNLKQMMNEGVIGTYIKRQNKLNERIEEVREDKGFHSVGEIKRFAENNQDISEDLSVSMERSLTNMKKKQSRGKPSQAVSKSISTLLDIDADVIELLSDNEKEKLGTQLQKLNKVVSELNSVCDEDEIPVSDFQKEKSEMITEKVSAFPTLSPTKPEHPFVYCKNIGMTITNLGFSLYFGAFGYSDKQSDTAKVTVYFTDSDGHGISPEQQVEVKVGEMTKVFFTLNDEASAKKECFLIIKAWESNGSEALAMIPFKINISFSLDFSF